MPVRKYRSVEEMAPVPPGRPLDPNNLRAAMQLIALLYRLRPWRFPRGVHRHRSLEEANLAREAWDRAGDRRA